MQEQYAYTGRSLDEFWRLTLREVAVCIEQHARRQDHEQWREAGHTAVVASAFGAQTTQSKIAGPDLAARIRFEMRQQRGDEAFANGWQAISDDVDAEAREKGRRRATGKEGARGRRWKGKR